jgi:predicted transcriptional regulator
LSIKPPYAEAIFRGDKRYEFRRVGFGRNVDIVVVYVTSPVCEVWGEFEVADIIRDEPTHLWRRTKDAAGIERRTFFEYFAGTESGYAIKIKHARRYEQPKHIRHDFGVLPPQSFAYL